MTNIIDQAIFMKVIEINVQIQKENKVTNGKMKIGMVYEGKEGIFAIPEKNNGEWKIYPQDVRVLYE